ncbi:MAG: retention module-containing protein, partial [Desulfobulbaceae bacterium]|nr:retention module-containing protein [Desulfobulbaceae bacterium]
MADNKQVLESSTVSQEPVGKVFIVYGTAKVISSDGTTRALAPNSAIYAQDRILTESDGRLSIVFNDSTNSQLNLGRMSDIVIDEDVYNTDTADLAEVTSEVEEIQEALLAEGFDPTTELAAPAAGDAGSASDGGGHPVVSFEATGEVVVPTSGAETTGVERSFLDPVGGINEPDLRTPSSEQLDINVNLSASSEAYEGGLITYTVTLSDAVKK